MAQGFTLLDLPRYAVPQPLDLSPLQQAIQFAARQQQAAIENERAAQKLKLDQNRDTREAEKAPIEREGLTLSNQSTREAMKRAAELQPGALEAQRAGIDQTRASTGLTSAQADAARIKADEAKNPELAYTRRAQMAAQYGLKPGTREHNEFVLTGDFPKGQRPNLKEVNGKLVQLMPDGSVRVVYDGGPDFSKLPEFSAKAAGFASRMVDAEQNIRNIMGGAPEKAGGAPREKFDPTTGKAWIGNAMTGMPGENVMNFFVRGEDQQRYIQAARQWIRAFLRKESGAAIGEKEFSEDFKTYFPQPGDSPAVVADKERARLRAKQSFIGESRGFFENQNPDQVALLKQWNMDGKDQSRLPGNAQAAPSEAVTIRSDADYDRLPSGATYIGPDGVKRTKR